MSEAQAPRIIPRTTSKPVPTSAAVEVIKAVEEAIGNIIVFFGDFLKDDWCQF